MSSFTNLSISFLESKFLFDCDFLLTFCERFGSIISKYNSGSLFEILLEDLNKRWSKLNLSFKNIMRSSEFDHNSEFKINAQINFEACANSYYLYNAQILDLLVNPEEVIIDPKFFPIPKLKPLTSQVPSKRIISEQIECLSSITEHLENAIYEKDTIITPQSERETSLPKISVDQINTEPARIMNDDKDETFTYNIYHASENFSKVFNSYSSIRQHQLFWRGSLSHCFSVRTGITLIGFIKSINTASNKGHSRIALVIMVLPEPKYPNLLPIDFEHTTLPPYKFSIRWKLKFLLKRYKWKEKPAYRRFFSL